MLHLFFKRVSSNKETHHDPPLFGSREDCTRTRDDCLLSNIYTDLHGVPADVLSLDVCLLQVDVPAQGIIHWNHHQKPFQKTTSFRRIPWPSWITWNPTSSVFAKRHVHICPGRPTSSLRWKRNPQLRWRWENDGKMMGKWWENDGTWWENDGKMMENDEKMMRKSWKMMRKWWKNDEKMMENAGKWWENDGKMMEKWWKNDGTSRNLHELCHFCLSELEKKPAPSIPPESVAAKLHRKRTSFSTR